MTRKKETNKKTKQEIHLTQQIPVPTGFGCANCGTTWWTSEIKAHITGGRLRGETSTGFQFEAIYGGRMMSCPNCP